MNKFHHIIEWIWDGEVFLASLLTVVLPAAALAACNPDGTELYCDSVVGTNCLSFSLPSWGNADFFDLATCRPVDLGQVGKSPGRQVASGVAGCGPRHAVQRRPTPSIS